MLGRHHPARLQEWSRAGLSEQVQTVALQAYDRMIGLELEDLAVDGCLTKAPSGVKSPATRRWIGASRDCERSVVTEGSGIPLHLGSAGVTCLAPSRSRLASSKVRWRLGS